MHIRVIRIVKWFGAIFLMGVFCNAIAKESPTIKFSFAPKANMSFTQKLTMIKEKKFEGGASQTEESFSTTKITILKTKAGWDVLAEPKNIVLKRNGEPVQNPLANLLASAVITYKLDPNGEIVDISGIEAFIDGLAKQLPPEVFKQLAPILNADAMKAKEKVEWQGRVGDFLGASVVIGDSFVADAPFQLPNGSIMTYQIKTNIAALVPCGKKKCVRIEQTYSSQADNVAKLAGQVTSNTVQAIAPEMPKLNSENNEAMITGLVTRVVDPKTMLFYGENSSRTIAMKMDIPGKGLIPITLIETRKYEFIY